MAQYGYSILFCVVLGEALGLPIPAALGLLSAGAASARHALDPGMALLASLGAMLLGDNLLFLMGRYTGWWLLSMLCRFSLNPESCILTSADLFHKRGRIILLFAKFLPGVNTMAAPLAGSMNLPFAQFFPLDLAGACIYVGSYFAVGYLFSDFLNLIVRGYSVAGSLIGWAVAILAVLWLANRIRWWLKVRSEAPVPMMTPREVLAHPSVVIFDVRSHGYYDQGAMRIKDSVRLDPNALEGQVESLPHDREIVLYCTCLREATAVRVARALAAKGVPSSVLAGGFSGWKKAGLPLEPVPSEDVVMLPKFA